MHDIPLKKHEHNDIWTCGKNVKDSIARGWKEGASVFRFLHRFTICIERTTIAYLDIEFRVAPVGRDGGWTIHTT